MILKISLVGSGLKRIWESQKNAHICKRSPRVSQAFIKYPRVVAEEALAFEKYSHFPKFEPKFSRDNQLSWEVIYGQKFRNVFN